MDDKKDKKKILTISTSVSKKINLSSLDKGGKKTFSIDKKKPFRSQRDQSTSGQALKKPIKKNFVRKFVEQQATKAFIKKDEKAAPKSKLKLKGPIDKKDFKLTISRALNVEEIEIKQRSLASVKRARLKEKKHHWNRWKKGI